MRGEYPFPKLQGVQINMRIDRDEFEIVFVELCCKFKFFILKVIIKLCLLELFYENGKRLQWCVCNISFVYKNFLFILSTTVCNQNVKKLILNSSRPKSYGLQFSHNVSINKSIIYWNYAFRALRACLLFQLLIMAYVSIFSLYSMKKICGFRKIFCALAFYKIK